MQFTISGFMQLTKAQRAELTAVTIDPYMHINASKLIELSNNQLKKFTAALSECNKLVSLDLSRQAIGLFSKEGLQILLQGLRPLSAQLQELNLSCNAMYMLDQAKFDLLMGMVERCENLHTLKWSSNRLGMEDSDKGDRFIQMLNIRANGLRKLYLNDNNLNDLDSIIFNSLFQSLKACPQLQIIALSEMNIYCKSGFNLLKELLIACPSIQSLDISHLRYAHFSHAADLFDALAQAKQLRNLNLGHCCLGEISNAHFILLLETLSNLRNLNSLDLTKNNLHALSPEMLVRSKWYINESDFLAILNLKDNGLGSERPKKSLTFSFTSSFEPAKQEATQAPYKGALRTRL